MCMCVQELQKQDEYLFARLANNSIIFCLSLQAQKMLANIKFLASCKVRFVIKFFVHKNCLLLKYYIESSA